MGMSTTLHARPRLPALPLDEWEGTKNTLHLWAQIVGKVRMASSVPRNHWWHVPLYLDVRGLTTRRLHSLQGLAFQIASTSSTHRPPSSETSATSSTNRSRSSTASRWRHSTRSCTLR